MSTTTISLADDAYHRLRSRKGPDESFSDVVRRLTVDARLTEYRGAVTASTARRAREHLDGS